MSRSYLFIRQNVYSSLPVSCVRQNSWAVSRSCYKQLVVRTEGSTESADVDMPNDESFTDSIAREQWKFSKVMADLNYIVLD
jgi:hypothetical protein